MSTTANIVVGTKTYSLSHDGYPECMLPFLNEVVEGARKFADRNPDFDLLRAIQYHLSEELEEGGYSNPCYEYTIDPEGVISWDQF